MALTAGQMAMARLIMAEGARAGLPLNRQRELVAAAYAESGLNPRSVNKSSGAAGLFQLLSSGYVNQAKKLGGLYNPTANTRAIINDYVRYWKSHPNAAPGAGGRDVELSGMGAGFYSHPLSLIGGVTPPGAGPGAGPVPAPPRAGGSPPGPPSLAPPVGFGPSTVHQFDPSMLAQGIFSGLASGEMPNVAALTAQSYKDIKLPGFQLPRKRQAPGVGPDPQSDASPPPDKAVTAVTPKNVSKWAVAGSGMDRGGMRTNPAVFTAVARIAQIYGHPLTIGTGSNHREFVQGRPGHRSDHWFGEAADIPMSGDALTRLGQDALIMAGMSPAEARKQTGGVFNIGGYNILFNTQVGGNHYNHLHVGLGRIIGRPA